MNIDKLNDYVNILEIFIDHYKSRRKTLLTPKEIKEQFGVGKRSNSDYERKKRTLDRCMEFYSFIKLITIQTDSTLNEENRLSRIRKNRLFPLEERKQLNPYIEFISNERINHTTDDECLKYNLVGRFKRFNEMYVDDNNEEYTEKELELLQTQLPKKIEEYPKDDKGFHTIKFKSGTEYKIKRVEKQSTKYEMYGEKFQNIETDMEIDFIDSNGIKRNLSKDKVIIENKDIKVCDFDDIYVRAEDCLYSLTQQNECNDDIPIEFKIPSNDKINMFVKFIDGMISKNLTEDGQYDMDLTDTLISTVINSNAFGLQTDFVTQTIGKLTIFNHNNSNISNKTEGYYPLYILIQIIESGNSIDIEFENSGNNLKLQNTKLKKIVINENLFDLHLDNFMSQNHTDISQIKKITNHSEDELRNNVDKVNELINGLDNRYKEYFEKKFDSLTSVFNLFVF